MTTNTDILADLYEDGAAVVLPDGRTLRLTIEHDPYTDINDYECYGRTWWEPNSDCGPRRPPGFGPHARIMRRDGRHTPWWNPEPELWGTSKPWGPGTFDDDFANARRLVEEGFTFVTLTMSETLTDSLGAEHEVEIASQSIGGVDTEDPSYINELARELAFEMGVES